jgi:hypothetical protein
MFLKSFYCLLLLVKETVSCQQQGLAQLRAEKVAKT